MVGRGSAHGPRGRDEVTMGSIELLDPARSAVVVIDLQGKLLLSDTNTAKLSVATLPNGVYLLEIRSLETSGRVIERIVKKE